mmetsp:Transcript_70384/g.201644  ORF Transcript_70384/g.201644 Transcript_70384/m.201644 type:complete len:203 (+) Transcript_70384:511-1119(+)
MGVDRRLVRGRAPLQGSPGRAQLVARLLPAARSIGLSAVGVAAGVAPGPVHGDRQERGRLRRVSRGDSGLRQHSAGAGRPRPRPRAATRGPAGGLRAAAAGYDKHLAWWRTPVVGCSHPSRRQGHRSGSELPVGRRGLVAENRGAVCGLALHRGVPLHRRSGAQDPAPQPPRGEPRKWWRGSRRQPLPVGAVVARGPGHALR